MRTPAECSAEATTVVAALEGAAEIVDRGFVFVGRRGRETRYSFAEVAEQAKRRGRQLAARGLSKGDRLGIIVPDNEEFVLTFLGAITAGIVPVPMYPPLALGELDAYHRLASGVLTKSGARVLVTSEEVSAVLWPLLDSCREVEDLVTVEVLRDAPESSAPLPAIEPDDVCFVQFTSGSTASPKGVVVTHESLIANAHAIMFDGLGCQPETDRAVSWLPLYHDMGLIGFVVSPLYARMPTVFLSTLAFVKRPRRWMEAVDKYDGTITFAPNFAFALASRRASQIDAGLDLSKLRVLGCGAEPINAAVLRRFVDAYGPLGLNPNAVMPCYGMAEATLAMSFEGLDEPFVTIRIDRDAYEIDSRAQPLQGEGEGLELVARGRTFPKHELGIWSPDGRLLPQGRVGEVSFRGPSVTAGYYEDEAATAEAFRDGWLFTGDLGFLLDGRLYLSGRKKDLIILSGRNHHPQAIEWEVEQVPGVRKGNVVAFADQGEQTERLVVAAETKQEDHEPLIAAIRQRLNDAFALYADEIVLVPAGALPKTSSGKLQRGKARQQHRSGRLGAEGDRTKGKAARGWVLARHLGRSLLARARHRFRRGRIP